MIKKIILKNFTLEEFEKLFKEYYENLCRFALRFTQDYESAEEVVQEVFYKLWEKKDTIIIKTSVNSYLYTSVRNRCIQQINRQKIRRKYLNNMMDEEKISNLSSDSDLILNESIEIFNEALNTLPEKCRTIFKMSRFEGLKYKEIAFELSISVKTVEAYISKSLKHFRKYFPEYA